ncbi:MAG: efflux RND transporter periplasmic adaptor subunit [Planctomycetota bacterium]
MWVAIGFMIFAGVSCDGLSGAQGSGAAAKPAAGPKPTRPLVADIPVAVTPVTNGQISTYYHATATLQVERSADVVARVAGVIESLKVEEGDEVLTDAPLLEIDNDAYQFRLDQVSSRRKFLAAKLARMEKLSEDLFSQEEHDTALNELDVAKADERLAKLDVEFTEVLSPFAGRVVSRVVDVGQNVSIGDVLFTIADFEPLLARVYVPSREFRQLQIQQTVELVLDSTGEKLKGKITLVSPVIRENTGTIKVTVEIPSYPESVRPGDFAKVRIVTETRPDTLLVPRGAVLTEKGDSVVYTESEGVAQRQVVDVGFVDDERAEILRGVELGQNVVVRGQRSLKHGSRVKVLQDALSKPIVRGGK